MWGSASFGVFVSTLPSQHEGGAMCIRRGSGDVVVESGGDGGYFDMQYLAFYLGCA